MNLFITLIGLLVLPQFWPLGVLLIAVGIIRSAKTNTL